MNNCYRILRLVSYADTCEKEAVDFNRGFNSFTLCSGSGATAIAFLLMNTLHIANTSGKLKGYQDNRIIA